MREGNMRREPNAERLLGRGTIMRALLALSAVCAPAAWAAADDKIWIGIANGNFNSGGNWSPAGVPGNADIANFTLGNVTPPYNVLFLSGFNPINAVVDRLRIATNPLTFTVPASTLTVDSANTTETARGLIVGRAGTGTPNAVLNNLLSQFNTVYATFGVDAGSSGTLNVNGGTFNVTGMNAVWDLILGRNGAGTINVNSGSDVTVGDDTVLGLNAGANGAISVTGLGSTWASTGDLTIGGAGVGTLTVSADGDINTSSISIADAAGSNGTITVTGAGSKWTTLPAGTVHYIGRSGTGTLNVTAGGRVEYDPNSFSDSFVVIGDAPGSSGTVNVSGSGSTWKFPDVLIVGNSGNGTLNITNGGGAIFGIGVGGGESSIAYGGGAGEVIVANSQWWNDQLFVGRNGHGTLEINDGLVVANHINIGYSPGSTGAVIVDGPSSRILTGGISSAEIVVGDLGSGTLEIRNGGEVDVTYGADGGVLVNPNGSLIVDGKGSLCSALQFVVGGIVNLINGGTVDGGTVIVVTLMSIYPQGQLHGEGTIVGSLNNAGVVSPGSSPGVLQVNGDFAQTADGDLLIELASASSYDQLHITGSAALGGTLTVNLINGFAPTPGQTFTIVTAANVNGTFAQTNLPPGMRAIYTGTSVILQMGGTLCPADIAPNGGDGVVNVDDLLLVINSWGFCPPPPADCPGDIAPPPSGNGVVNVDDLLAVINNWGPCP